VSTAEKWDMVSEADYLAGELVAEERHEYIAGVVYAMAGASNRHNEIAGNVFGALFSRLRGLPCKPWNPDTKVRVLMATGTRYYYPDAMVVCDSNRDSESFQDRPAVIVEVLSESTRRTDKL
jgi:Uma2 family endonuclease